MSLIPFAQSPATRCDASGIWNVPAITTKSGAILIPAGMTICSSHYLEHVCYPPPSVTVIIPAGMAAGSAG